MYNDPPTGFFAYPSYPPSIGETIRGAAREINKTSTAAIKTWEECRVGGKVVIQELCEEIAQADIFCADLTEMNPNVMFELGYAIAKNRRIWLILDTTITASKTHFEQLRVLTTIGYAKYCNSSDIVRGFLKDQPFSDLQNTIFERAIRPHLTPTTSEKILYLKSLHDTEASIQVTKRVRTLGAADVSIIVDDPKESSVQTLTWYGSQVYSSIGVLCHLSGPQRTGSRLHNARYALVAGMAYGMEKNLLMLAEGDFLAPIDYRELLFNYLTPSEAMKNLEVWLSVFESQLYERRAKRSSHISSVKLATELKGLDFGEYVAENEAERLVQDYFVETQAYREALEGPHAIFVGRKGSGKTANLLKLAATLGKDKRNLVCVIKPVAYELQGIVELFRKYKGRDAKGYAIESLWKFLLFTEMGNVVAEELRKLPSGMLREEEANLLRLLDRERGKLGGEFAIRLERCVESLIRRESPEDKVESFRLGVSEALHQGELGELRLLLGSVLSSRKRVAILIDNLDKAWDKQSDLNTLAEFLLGLLGATNRVTVDFKHEDSRRRAVNVGLAVFLRSDIFYKLMSVAREPDKIVFSRLCWQDAELLRRVVEERFVASHEGTVHHQDLWDSYFCYAVKDLPTRDYFVGKILPRPRDLVFFVKAAVSMAVNRGQPRVRESDILDAEKQYSQYALESILVENGASFANLEQVLYEFVGCPAVLTDEEVRSQLAKAGTSEDNCQQVIDHLASLSFLGMEVRDNDFRYSEDPQDYRKNVTLARRLSEQRGRSPRYRIHPAFWSYLEVVE